MKAQLSELATILNAFKSEAVQLRILDLVLEKQSTEETPDRLVSGKTTGRSRKQRKPTTKKTDVAAPTKRKKASAGTGAVATLTDLLSGTYCDKPRGIGDIVKHCKDKLARTFKPNDFSGKLARMVRSGELTREKNADSQYEYKKPS